MNCATSFASGFQGVAETGSHENRQVTRRLPVLPSEVQVVYLIFSFLVTRYSTGQCGNSVPFWATFLFIGGLWKVGGKPPAWWWPFVYRTMPISRLTFTLTCLSPWVLCSLPLIQLSGWIYIDIFFLICKHVSKDPWKSTVIWQIAYKDSVEI